MVFVVLCSALALLTFAQVAEKDACDNKRVRADCIGSPESCYWDSSKEGTGHACVKFSGDCRTIITNNSAVCTGAGQGGLCDYLPNVCVNNCSLLNYSSSMCNNQPHCFYVGGTPARCLRCEEITVDTECTGKDYCKWNASITSSNKCSVDRCRTLYTSSNYYYYDNNECNRDSTCYVRTGYYSSDGDCKEFINCDSITTVYTSYSCNSHEGCYYQSSSCQVDSRTTCATYISRDNCVGNISCYWDSTVSKCFELYGNCESVQTGNSSDCSSARRDFSGNVKNCTWKEGIGCVTSCTDYPQTTYESTCRYNRDDCWWDSGAYNGCKNFSSCGDINTDRDACLDHNKTCYWDGTRCYSYTHCSQITNSSICNTLTSKCVWNTTVCVDNCSEVKNEYDCWDRSYCYWPNNNCQYRGHSACSAYNNYQSDCNDRQYCYFNNSDNTCRNFSKCDDITSSYYCNYRGKRCAWDTSLGRCVPEFHSPVNDSNGKGCSAYQTPRACNADSLCVWNQKVNSNYRSQCQNFTNCSEISYADFGGVFYNALDDCQAKPGCYWKNSSDQRWGCDYFLGECVRNETVVLCGEYNESVACDEKKGCYWNSSYSGCYPRTCSGLDKIHCSTQTECEWEENANSCRDKCSVYTSSASCREITRCFWNVSKCDVFDECKNITEFEECSLRDFSDCVWIGTKATDITPGFCVDTTEKNNLIVRGCDDYRNADQCNNDTRYASGGLKCVFLWNAAHDDGICTAVNMTLLTNCSVYKNKEQCINIVGSGNSGCYWTGGGYCQEYIDCSYIPIDDCESSFRCGVQEGNCTYTVCSGRTKERCSGKCEWYGNRYGCLMKGANVNVRISTTEFTLGVGDSSDPCYSKSGNITLCNADKTTCNLGCVYNSQYVFGSASCIIFRNCSDIKYPLFQYAQRDCDARIPCYWADGVCGLDEPKSSKTKKSLSSGAIAAIVIVVSIVAFVIIIVLLVLVYVILRRKKKTGVEEDGSVTTNQDDDATPSKGEVVPVSSGEEALIGNEEETLAGNGEGKESEVSDL